MPTLSRAARISATIPLILISVALAACGTAAAPRSSAPAQPAQPAGGGMAPTMAKLPTDAAQAASAGQPAGDPRSLGDPNAPITIVEYGDYQ